MTRGRGAVGGFTLIEVLVALVLLEVGVLAAAGMLLLASRILERAERTERGVTALEWVADSLRAHEGVGAGAGERAFGDVRVLWTRGTGEDLSVLVAVDARGDTLARVGRTGAGP